MTPTRIPRPSLSELVFVLWAMVIPLVFTHRLLNGDGDMARHIRLGLIMLERGGVLREDVFSWTRAGEPFLAFEWGSEVFFGIVYSASGLAGVAVASGLVLAVSYALLCRFMLARGVEPVLAYLAVIGAVVMSSAHWVARPHLFTFLGVSLLLPLLEDARIGRAWLAVPLFAAWCNMHGGFVYGLILVGIYAGGSLLEAWRTEERSAWLRRSRANLAVAGLGLVATLVNPNGLELHRHVRDFFGLTLLLEVTEEFQPPDFTTATGIVMLGGIAAVLAAVAWSRRRPTWPRTGVIASNLLFALRARRNLALFGIAAFPITALHVDSRWRALPDFGGVRATFARDQARATPGIWTAAALTMLVALVAAGGRAGEPSLLNARFDPRIFPVDAVTEARRAGLTGKLFNDVTWGGYLLLTWPEQKVFMDGGTDHYGEALVSEAIGIAALEDGWEARLDGLGVDVVLLPPATRLVHALVNDRGWELWFCDRTAAVVRRPSAPGPSRPSPPEAGHPPFCPRS